MIEPASLIGFGVAFLAAAWMGSALLGTAALLGTRRLERRGPAAVRAAATAALLLGPLLGIVLVLAVAGNSLADGWLGVADHCPEHDHHLHLCVVHGGSWASQPWAVATVAMAGTWMLVAVARRLTGVLHARRALHRIERLARPVDAGVLVAPAATRFCFTAGMLRPRIFISSAAWQALDRDQRRAVVAHEQAHIRGGDLGRRALLGLAALAGAPLLAGRMLALWDRATERLCDQQAAREVTPAVVAQALLAMSRGPVAAPAGLSFGARADVVARIEGVLADGPTGGTAARRLSAVAVLILAVAAAAAIAFADPLHHLAETFLGAL